MFDQLRKLNSVEQLARRVNELEAENARLRDENSRRLMQTSFNAVKTPVAFPVDLRDHIVDRVTDDMSPIIESHLIRVLKDAKQAMQPRRGQSFSRQVVNVAMADMCDGQVEVSLPEIRTAFRVAGMFR
tara:strand:+ start:832 stop:1218 length:387 start_codon:yes stop_codon:yes gene_type:complete